MCCYSKHVNAVLYNWWLDIASHFLTHFLMVDISGCFLCSAWEKLCINRKAICGKMISNKPSFCLLSNRDTISFSAPSLFVAASSVCWINLRWSCFDLPCPQRLHCQHCFSDESWVFFVFGHEKIFSCLKFFLNTMRACLHLLLCCQWCRWSFLWSTSSFEWRS